MADERRPIKLALSLHATTNGLRRQLMPIANKYSLEDLGNALEYYYRSTKIPVTFEYILFRDLNDSPLDVQRLARLSRRVPTKVNVIPFHTIEFAHPSGLGLSLQPATPERFHSFISDLQKEHVTVMIRSSSGLDIDAACGQLALSHSESIDE
jgi:23S rRNA (adenine2503-C2)-methyltransferase